MTKPTLSEDGKNGRQYVHPLTGERVPSVTTVIGLAEKSGLGQWKINVAVEAALRAFQNGASFEEALVIGKDAPGQQASTKAKIGDQVHEAIMHYLLGEPFDSTGIEGYLSAFEAFVKRYDVHFVQVEQTVWSEQWRYAGTFDFIAEVGGRFYIGDWKTGKRLYDSVAYQLSALAHADYILHEDGSTEPLPEIHGGVGVILNQDPRTGEGSFGENLVDIGEDTWRGFIGLRERYASQYERPSPWKIGSLNDVLSADPPVPIDEEIDSEPFDALSL